MIQQDRSASLSAGIKRGDVFTYAGCWAVVRAVARDGSWARVRFVKRLLPVPGERACWPLPLPSSFRPASDGTMPLHRLAHIPDEWLDAYMASARLESDCGSAVLFASRMESARRLYDLEVRHGWDFRPDVADAAEEWVRRREARGPVPQPPSRVAELDQRIAEAEEWPTELATRLGGKLTPERYEAVMRGADEHLARLRGRRAKLS